MVNHEIHESQAKVWVKDMAGGCCIRKVIGMALPRIEFCFLKRR